MDSKLFRKSAVDSVSSPEQLDEYMKVTGPFVWLVLSALIIVFAGFFAWGFLGSIPETVTLTGTVLAPGAAGAPAGVYCYLPIDGARQLTEGMEVRISPVYAPKEQFGYIHGTVKSIGLTPVTEEYLAGTLGSNLSFLPMPLPPGNAIEVIIEPLKRDGVLLWSSSKGTYVNVTLGSTCTLEIIKTERRPYELMFR